LAAFASPVRLSLQKVEKAALRLCGAQGFLTSWGLLCRSFPEVVFFLNLFSALFAVQGPSKNFFGHQVLNNFAMTRFAVSVLKQEFLLTA
jgi:hypothetical protein